MIELPTIKTVPSFDGEAFEAHARTLSEGGFDWLVFTSPSGVRIFFDRLLGARDIRCLSGVRIASIGKGTEKVLSKMGLKSDLVPSVYDGETLGRELAAICRGGERILIPRASEGNQALTASLREAGAEVTDFPVYDTLTNASGVIDEKALIESGGFDFAVFTSASTVRGFAAAAGGADLKGVRAVCIGKQTAAAAEGFGMMTWTADMATIESLADALERAAEETGLKHT